MVGAGLLGGAAEAWGAAADWVLGEAAWICGVAGKGPVFRPGSGKVGISDRDEFRPASSCWANSAPVRGKGVCGDEAEGSGEW